MRGKEDRLAHARELAEQCAELDAGARVEIARRLVEHEHLRIVQERASEHDSLLLPLGEGGDMDRSKRSDRSELQDPLDGSRPVLSVDPVRARVKMKILGYRDAFVDAVSVRHVADDATDSLGMGGHIVAGDARGARGGLEQRRKDTQSRRLPCAVRANETINRTPWHLEGDTSKDRLRTEEMNEALTLDDGRLGRPRLLGAQKAIGPLGSRSKRESHPLIVAPKSRARPLRLVSQSGSKFEPTP